MRGRTLNANMLAYLPSVGTYQMETIYSREVSKSGLRTWTVLQTADETKQDSLETEAVFDEMNTEQTWPTEQELNEAQKKLLKKKFQKELQITKLHGSLILKM